MNFVLPIKINKSKKKKVLLNLNTYRNAHYQTLNYMKKEFKRIFTERYGKFPGPPMEKCFLEYTIFFPSARRTDLSNVACIVDKFESDCLVELGYIVEDNREVVDLIYYRDGGIDRENPRAELKVTEIVEVDPVSVEEFFKHFEGKPSI